MDKWWWLTSFNPRWSREEVYARAQMGGAASLVFLLLEVPIFVFLPRHLNTPLVAILLVIPALFASVFAARPICEHLWPDLIKAGDERSAQRAIEENLS
jgi:hypothetical protein